MFTPYVYKITNKLTNQFYVGKKISGKHTKEIGIDYFTSSKTVKPLFENHIEDWEIEKIFINEDLKKVSDFETEEIKKHFNNPFCLNKSFQPTDGTYILNDETKEKISQLKKEYYKTHKNSKKDSKISEAVKEKISNSLKEYYKTHKNPMEGKKHSKETLEKQRKCKEGKYKKENNPNFKKWIILNCYIVNGLEEAWKKCLELKLCKSPNLNAFKTWRLRHKEIVCEY